MEVGLTKDYLNEYYSYWQTPEAISAIKDNSTASMGSAIGSTLPIGWGGKWDESTIKKNAGDETVVRNRFLPSEAGEYT